MKISRSSEKALIQRLASLKLAKAHDRDMQSGDAIWELNVILREGRLLTIERAQGVHPWSSSVYARRRPTVWFAQNNDELMQPNGFRRRLVDFRCRLSTALSNPVSAGQID